MERRDFGKRVEKTQRKRLRLVATILATAESEILEEKTRSEGLDQLLNGEIEIDPAFLGSSGMEGWTRRVRRRNADRRYLTG